MVSHDSIRNSPAISRSQHDANHAGEALFPTLVITMPMTRSDVLFQFLPGQRPITTRRNRAKETTLDKLQSERRDIRRLHDRLNDLLMIPS